MNNIRKTLEKIGLNDKEIKIYLTSLSIGQAPASLLGQRNNIVRSTAQYTCQSLADKWLMNVISKGNTFFYSPSEPEKLLSLVNREYDLVEKKFQATRVIMGDLKALMNPYAKLPKVKYFTGVDGIIEMYEDVLKEGKSVYWYFKVWDIHPKVLHYLNTRYLIERPKQWLEAFAIYNEDENYKKYFTKAPRNWVSVPEDIFWFESCMQIYGNKVSYYSYFQDDVSWVIIENDHIAKSQMTLFKLAYQYGKILEEEK